MTSRGPLGAVVVGAGLMGRWHADAVARSGNRVACIVDSEITRAERLAARHRYARVASSLDDAFGRARFDVVHVCTPLATHAVLAAQALTAGAHAIVEKPLADDAEQTRRLLEIAAARGVMLVPVHQMPFQRGVVAARESCRLLGPVLHLDTTACTAGAEGGGDRDQLALDIVPHPLSLVQHFVSPALADAEWRVVRLGAGELRLTAEIGGTAVGMVISTRGRPTTNTLRMICARGTVNVDLFHGFAVVATGAATRTYKLMQPFSVAAHTISAAAANLVTRSLSGEPAYPGLRSLIAQLYAAARAHSAPPISPDETLQVAVVRDRIIAQLTGARAVHDAAPMVPV